MRRLYCLVLLFVAVSSAASANESACDMSLDTSKCKIPPILIAPDQPSYHVWIATPEGVPVSGAVVRVVIPACYSGSKVPNHAAGAWSHDEYVSASAYEFADTTDAGGLATFDWSLLAGPDPSGGCIPVSLTGPSGSCATALGCQEALVKVYWNNNGTFVCGEVKRSIVSPDIASDGRMCDAMPWAADSTATVGLEDAIQFTPPLASNDYDECVDLNGDNQVNVADAVWLTPYLSNGTSCNRTASADPFFGDSLNLPIGVGDAASAIGHARNMGSVQSLIAECESNGYERHQENDQAFSSVTADGVYMTNVVMAFEYTDDSLPDSVVAVPIISVVTSYDGSERTTSHGFVLMVGNTGSASAIVDVGRDSASAVVTIPSEQSHEYTSMDTPYSSLPAEGQGWTITLPPGTFRFVGKVASCHIRGSAPRIVAYLAALRATLVPPNPAAAGWVTAGFVGAQMMGAAGCVYEAATTN